MTMQSQAVCEINLKKMALLFKSFLGLAKGNESRHYTFCCFLRIMIFKVYRCKFSQQNGNFLK